MSSPSEHIFDNHLSVPGEETAATLERESSNAIVLIFLLLAGMTMVAVFLWQEWRLTGRLDGVPLDDSWIHYRFAGNLADGNGFAFNPGQPTPGSTSPLWVVVLSLLGGGYLLPSKLAGILAYLAIPLLVYFIGAKFGLRRAYAVLAGVGAAIAGRLVWAAPSGMETTAFTLVSLALLFVWDRKKDGRIPAWVSLAFGLACLLRPEGYLLVGLSAIAWWLEMRASRITPRKWTSLAAHLMLAGLVVVPYLLFSYQTTGRPLPNTFYVKSSTWDCQIGPGYFGWIAAIFLLDNPVLAPLAVLGLVVAARRSKWGARPAVLLAGLWLVALPGLYGLLAPCISGYYTRYTTPLVPVAMLFGAIGAQYLEDWWVSRLAKRRKRPAIKAKPGKARPGKARPSLVLMVAIEGCFLALLPAFFFWGPYYAQGVADIRLMHLEIGRWLSENTRPADVLALNDIGAIGVLADRQVIDLAGLVSPQVLPYVVGKQPGEWDAGLADFLRAERPDYLVIFPNWFPRLVTLLPVEQVYQARLPDRSIAGIRGLTVAGGGEMVVYRLNWGVAEK